MNIRLSRIIVSNIEVKCPEKFRVSAWQSAHAVQERCQPKQKLLYSIAEDENKNPILNLRQKGIIGLFKRILKDNKLKISAKEDLWEMFPPKFIELYQQSFVKH